MTDDVFLVPRQAAKYVVVEITAQKDHIEYSQVTAGCIYIMNMRCGPNIINLHILHTVASDQSWDRYGDNPY
jgi:hypothetical protein